MTVQELIDTLQCYDPDMEVQISYTSADYWRTQIADDIDSIDEGEVDYSEYHQKFRVIDEDDDDQRDPKTVVLITA